MEQNHYFIGALNSNVEFETDLLIEYKGLNFQIQKSCQPDKTARIVVVLRDNFESPYKKLTEFISAFMFANKGAKLKIGDSIILSSFESDLGMLGYSPRRWTNTVSLSDNFDLAFIESEEQGTLLRLYRHAAISEDPYSCFLFFWQALVFPSSDDREAAKYIDLAISKIKNEQFEFALYDLSDRIFYNGNEKNSLGDYLRRGVRNTIAHIIRSSPDYSNLELDDLQKVNHIKSCCEVLSQIVEHRLINDLGLRIGADLNIFKVKTSKEGI